MPKITAIYCRSAISEKANIENQIKKILIFLLEQGKTNYKFFIDDGFSGEKINRPAYQEMLGEIISGNVEMVVAVDTARFHRNFVNFSHFKLFCKYYTTELQVLS